MANGEGAGADDDLDGQDGNGAPSGDPKGSKDGKSEDDELVPASRLKAALANQRETYESQLGNLRAEFEAFKAGSKQSDDKGEQQPKRYSRTDLKAAVTAGNITQEQSDDIWAKQVREEALEEAGRVALDTVNRKSQQEQIDTDLIQYKRLAPEIKDKTSEVFEKISAEFQYLRKRGSPDTLATELAAIRAVLGPLEKLEKARSASRSADHHQEGGGESGGGHGKPSKKVLDTLSPREKKFYEGQIEKGFHKDWAEVEQLLTKYASPVVRRRAGARV